MLTYLNCTHHSVHYYHNVQWAHLWPERWVSSMGSIHPEGKVQDYYWSLCMQEHTENVLNFAALIFCDNRRGFIFMT